MCDNYVDVHFSPFTYVETLVCGLCCLQKCQLIFRLASIEGDHRVNSCDYQRTVHWLRQEIHKLNALEDICKVNQPDAW